MTFTRAIFIVALVIIGLGCACAENEVIEVRTEDSYTSDEYINMATIEVLPVKYGTQFFVPEGRAFTIGVYGYTGDVIMNEWRGYAFAYRNSNTGKNLRAAIIKLRAMRNIQSPDDAIAVRKLIHNTTIWQLGSVGEVIVTIMFGNELSLRENVDVINTTTIFDSFVKVMNHHRVVPPHQYVESPFEFKDRRPPGLMDNPRDPLNPTSSASSMLCMSSIYLGCMLFIIQMCFPM